MKTNFRSSVLFIVIGSMAIIQACQKDDQFNQSFKKDHYLKEGFKYTPENTFYSSALSVGNGIARAWVKQNYKVSYS